MNDYLLVQAHEIEPEMPRNTEPIKVLRFPVPVGLPARRLSLLELEVLSECTGVLYQEGDIVMNAQGKLITLTPAVEDGKRWHRQHRVVETDVAINRKYGIEYLTQR